MNVDMDTSPSYFDSQELSLRERYRRYGKRLSPSPHQESYQSKFSNAALFLENIKKEVDHSDGDHSEGTHARTHSSFKRRSPSIDGRGISEMGVANDSVGRPRTHSLKVCKHEEDASSDGGDATFSLFASLFDSALQGLMSIPDLILRLEGACRNVSEFINNSCSERHRIVEEKLMRQKAKMLLDEAASWSLLWYLYGKGNEELPEDSIMLPTTSHLEACQFVAADHIAQLCLRLTQWLEGLASKALDLENKVRGSHVGTYLPTSGVWNHTQRFLQKGSSNEKIVQCLDFDAPTREHAQPLPDDKKQAESLLEDVWILLRAGRLEEACNLCRSAGQSWRAATLRPFGGLDHSPSIEALIRNGKNRSLQAMELESGINHQRRLWKWASYCASEKIAEQESGKYETAVYAANCSNVNRILPICTDWESACWALTKSWLDVQVDVELSHSQSGGIDQYRSSDGGTERSPGQGELNSQPFLGPENWPLQVVKQQPRDLSALLQKLHSSESVHEAVSRGCKEQHRQIEMSLMLGDIPRLLDLIWSWISPSGGDEDIFRPHGDPQMIRFGAHLVLVLRHLLADEMKDAFKEKTTALGDLILHMYAMYLFSKQHEELVGIYASQLARHRCIDLFVHMMELRLNGSVHVRYKIFLSAIEYLPFSPGDSNGSFEKGSFEEIIERVLSRSREVKVGNFDGSSDVAEQCRLQSLQKAMVIQWLCFTPPSTINDAMRVGTKLLLRALMHSNVLFREFALISMWRVPAMPIGAHTLLSLLAEPLKHPSETLFSPEDHEISDSLREFEDWNEYYSCDATYRNWLQVELENAEIDPPDVSNEEKQRATVVAMETLSSSMTLLLRKENPWLVPTEDHIYELMEPTNLELHATAMLCLPSGECMSPDATLCTALTSAFYSSVSEEVVSDRQLLVNVSISTKDSCSIEVSLRCLATENDGFGPNKLADGGVLAAVIAAGIKGELAGFQAGVTMEILRLDAWYCDNDGSLGSPATYIVRGLCRRCCIPEVILRCMQVSVSLMESGNAHDVQDELIELVAGSETGVLHLFSQNQLQEFLLFEREYRIWKMDESAA
ncbi:nuclear pore complex protein NUP107 isoform X1 [Cynara cardunculus var. scolymus]|uniref:nuclear pore complex protein NUP107 isoform X1 n=2 Tax=Cynara cardunculus var. scolymus TaxID=59895 RepID=UPI000D62D3C7|nr:nuclear pore complex protein NUP107 isoform X1 [Cynara cardunculus var. scolymus]